MCYGYGACPDELPSGKSGHRGKGPMYCNFDTDEEWEEAKKKAEDEADAHADDLYEQQRERLWGI